MASFLDNSCDIILDAVLTDHGRKVMARGDGSFQITKFSLGDEEIVYSLYNKTHASGSAYYDLEILQTPILQTCTDNATSMKSKLISYDDPNLLYLPVLKLNENDAQTKRHSDDLFAVACDLNTEGTSDTCTDSAIGFDENGDIVQGVMMGASLAGGAFIRIDQGLDTTEISAKQRIDPELIEDAYMIQMDGRFGSIATVAGDRIGPDYTDDDGIQFYTVTRADGVIVDNNDDSNSATQTISGPRGTRLEIKIAVSVHLNTSNFLFNQLGGETQMTTKSGSTETVRKIDTLIRVTGMKTGYTIDIPIRYIKSIT